MTHLCKKIFEEFANKKGFDPNVADNWYKTKSSDFYNFSVKCGAVLRAHKSLKRALSVAFPTMEIDESKFLKLYGYYRLPNRKIFFDDYARKNHFEPHDVDKWYKVKYNDIINEKGGRAVLRYYNNSVKNALLDVYTDLQWDDSKFNKKRRLEEKQNT